MADYDIDIEIDADSGDIVWNKGGKTYYYTVEELEGRGIIDNVLNGGAQITVYSQGQRYTVDEYEALFGGSA